MHDSLSILLPVRDAEAHLASEVERILHVAAELTDKLQLLVIDNGSTDQTLEIAFALASRFPQVRVLRRNIPCGFRQTVEAGLRRASGEVVLVRGPREAGDSPAGLAEMKRLWDLRRALRRGHSSQTKEATKVWLLVERQALARPQRRADASGLRSGPRRPRFLTRLRDFAVGE